MKRWEFYARRLLDLGPEQGLPDDLYARMKRTADLVERLGGELRSRQVIAAVIEQWEREKARSK